MKFNRLLLLPWIFVQYLTATAVCTHLVLKDNSSTESTVRLEYTVNTNRSILTIVECLFCYNILKYSVFNKVKSQTMEQIKVILPTCAGDVNLFRLRCSVSQSASSYKKHDHYHDHDRKMARHFQSSFPHNLLHF